MNLSNYNQRVVARLQEAIDHFAANELSVDDIQARLQSAGQLLENDGTGVSELIRLTEADVEEIRFTRLLAEQRSAVALLLEELLERIQRSGCQ